MMKIGNTDVYATETGGMIDVACRADSLAAMEQTGVALGLMYAESEDHPRVDGHLQTTPGVAIPHIGPVQIAPAVLDVLGIELTPTVFDHRHHFNMRLHGRALEVTLEDGSLKWQAMLLMWMRGQDDLLNNNNERGKKRDGITILDQTRFSSVERVWL